MYQCLFAERSCPARLNRAESVCFLAAPCALESQDRVDALVSAAEDVGLRCVVAERRQKFNRDIFCEKICKPIIEARFCMVLLDNARTRPRVRRTPNPNVYYEYGLMSALRKTVLTFTPKGQQIVFNVRHLDLVQYEPGDLCTTARAKCLEALSATAAAYAPDKRTREQPRRRQVPPLIRSARRVLELRGYKPAVPGVVGAGECGDTDFEPHVCDQGILFLSHVGQHGPTPRDIGNDCVLLARRLDDAWRRAQRAETAARSRKWHVKDVQRDMVLLRASRMLVVSALGGRELSRARQAIGNSAKAGFAEIPIEVWGRRELAQAEAKVGFSPGGMW